MINLHGAFAGTKITCETIILIPVDDGSSNGVDYTLQIARYFHNCTMCETIDIQCSDGVYIDGEFNKICN